MKDPKENPNPGKPDRNIPVKPHPHPDPARQVPERNDPTRNPPAVDPTRKPDGPPNPKSE